MTINPKFELPTIKKDENPLMIQGPAGEIFEFTRTGATTCGKYLISKAIVPPDAGPLPHFHYSFDEWFYAPDGGITLYKGVTAYPDKDKVPGVGAEKDVLQSVDMEPGDLIYIPRHYLHAFINKSNKSQVLYMIWTPDNEEVSMLNYFKEVGQIIEYPDNLPPIDESAKARFVSEAPRFGTMQSNNFWQYVEKVDDTPMILDSHTLELLDLLETGEKN